MVLSCLLSFFLLFFLSSLSFTLSSSSFFLSFTFPSFPLFFFLSLSLFLSFFLHIGRPVNLIPAYLTIDFDHFLPFFLPVIPNDRIEGMISERRTKGPWQHATSDNDLPITTTSTTITTSRMMTTTVSRTTTKSKGEKKKANWANGARCGLSNEYVVE